MAMWIARRWEWIRERTHLLLPVLMNYNTAVRLHPMAKLVHILDVQVNHPAIHTAHSLEGGQMADRHHQTATWERRSMVDRHLLIKVLCGSRYLVTRRGREMRLHRNKLSNTLG